MSQGDNFCFHNARYIILERKEQRTIFICFSSSAWLLALHAQPMLFDSRATLRRTTSTDLLPGSSASLLNRYHSADLWNTDLYCSSSSQSPSTSRLLSESVPMECGVLLTLMMPCTCEQPLIQKHPARLLFMQKKAKFVMMSEIPSARSSPHASWPSGTALRSRSMRAHFQHRSPSPSAPLST